MSKPTLKSKYHRKMMNVYWWLHEYTKKKYRVHLYAEPKAMK